ASTIASTRRQVRKPCTRCCKRRADRTAPRRTDKTAAAALSAASCCTTAAISDLRLYVGSPIAHCHRRGRAEHSHPARAQWPAHERPQLLEARVHRRL